MGASYPILKNIPSYNPDKHGQGQSDRFSAWDADLHHEEEPPTDHPEMELHC
jgi:hypothetical protein